ncbi:MAG: sugar transferase [Sporichthyaceae bacterium]
MALDALAALIAVITANVRYSGHPLVSQPLWQRVAFTATLVLLWLAAIAVSRSYEPRFLGLGSEEYRRILVAAVALMATVATASWAANATIARGYVIMALPLASVMTLLGRYGARKFVHRRRRIGYFMSDVVLVGHGHPAAELIQQMRRDAHHGMRVVGACVPDGRQSTELTDVGVPVWGSFDDIDTVVAGTAADAVAVLSCPEMDGAALRRLSWSLAQSGIDLLVAPALMDVAGPRIAIRPVCGLPLLHVDEPKLSGGRRVAKMCVDRTAAVVLLALLMPVLVSIGIAVRLSSRGPAIFRQKRLGWRGREFTMLKFRTMSQGAELQRAEMESSNADSSSHLFKLRNDPRVTPLGRWLRRMSLDELPQLVNIALGHMSLVGPRPLPSTDAPYEGEARRRLFVKPGLTGLWQISGRSDLDWDESVRLDLRYVENWSLALDALIIWKTLFAVLKHKGAY